MKIAIIGTGYVGLVSGACFAEMGVQVSCVDNNKEKIINLNNGILPIYEPGLEDLVANNVRTKRLQFTTNLGQAISNASVIFIAVGTPQGEDGSADLSYVLQVARSIGQLITDYRLIVTKSTVPVGTSIKVKTAIQEELAKRGITLNFDVASNPEFLKEGAAIKDFMSPDRVVVGTESEKAAKLMERLYKPFMLNSYRVIFMDIASAEMTKYAANAMLATRISFMNDIANLCEVVGADVNQVRIGMGGDQRIGNKFLYAGCGYGGSCFPKDVNALIRTASENGVHMRVVEAVEEVNKEQKKILFKKLVKHFGSTEQLKGKTIAIWGLSFKPETDDMREAPSLVLIEDLLKAGCKVNVYDPISVHEAYKTLGDTVTYSSDMYEAAIDANALVLVTEWKEFRIPSWSVLCKTMKERVIIDGRNIYDRTYAEAEGFKYYCIGK